MAEKLLAGRPLDDRPNDASNTIGEKTATLGTDVQTQETSAPPSFPGGLKQAFLIIALMLAIFLVGLDMVLARDSAFSYVLGAS
jgi:hypothetical protein